MRKVRCYECGRQYDFDTDDFCPKCGAFNQPPRETRIGADGTVVRVEGINEANHQNSFVHQELHEENRERRGTPLAKGARRGKSKTTVSRPAPQKAAQPWTVGKVIKWVVIGIIVLNLFSSLLSALLYI